jgi:IrrE N-terminal-like domain
MMDDQSPMAIIAQHQANWPVRVSEIARELGIKVKRIPLGSSIAGQFIRDSRRGGPSGFVAFINSDDSVTRQKFTLAHEIAHFVLHRDLIEDRVIDDTMYRSGLSSHLEAQANQLAADIIMPVRLVRKALRDTDDPKELAKMFQVSKQAMKIRLAGMKGAETPLPVVS